MPTTLARARDKFRTTLASAHAIGDGVLALAPGDAATLGAPGANRIWRVTAVTSPGTAQEVVLGVFDAAGVAGNNLTGVAAAPNYSDVAVPSGTPIHLRWTAEHVAERDDALSAAEAAIAANTTAIALKAPAFSVGNGVVLGPVPGGTPALNVSRAGRQHCIPKIVIDYEIGWPAAPGDADWVTADLSGDIPPGAHTAHFAWWADCPADARLYYRPVNLSGPTTGFVPGIDTKHARIVTTVVAGVRHGGEISIPLSPARKFQYLRSNPGGTINFGLYLVGWEGGRGVTAGAPEIIHAGSPGNYVGFPNSWTMPVSGSRLIAYYIGATHGGGGSIYLRRNEGAGAVLFTSTNFGGVLAGDAYPFHNPANPAQAVMVIYLVDGTSWVSTSNDDGATWAAPALMSAIQANGNTATSGPMQPFFFFPSADGSKILSNWYGQANGHAGGSTCLIEMSDATTRKVRGWVNYGDVYSGNECCTTRTASGRLVSVIRDASQLGPCATSVSTDDGLTWSAPVVQTHAIHGHKPGIPLGGGAFALLARYVPDGGAGAYGLCCFLFNESGTEVHRSAPAFLGTATESGYATVITEPDGITYAYVYSNTNVTDSSEPSLMRCVLEVRP